MMQFLLGVFLLLSSSFIFPASAHADGRSWSFSLIQAAQVRGGLKNTFTEHWPTYIAFLRMAKEFAGSEEGLGWEVEGQLVKHFGMQHHWETNALIVARWHPFPWDKYIDSSFAIGEGLSYATEEPEVEAERGQETARLLNYLMFELTFSLPEHPDWQAIVLMHHRSGAFGLFSGVHGGSNFIGYGIKYLFH